MTASSATTENPESSKSPADFDPLALEDRAAVKVVPSTKAMAAANSAAIAAMFEAALGKGGVQKVGHEAYPDPDLFTTAGIKSTLEAEERLIGLAQIEENGAPIFVGAMVADAFSPYHVEFNSMAVPVARRGQKIGTALVRGLSDMIEARPFTVNCTELVTHSLASQAAHFHNGFRSICGFGFCHYPHVFFADHPESVLWVTRLQGKLVPVMRRFRSALGRMLGRHLFDVKQKLITSQATGQVSLATGKLDEESLNIVSEILKERTAYVPKQYHDLVQSILFQFEEILDRNVKSWVRPGVEDSELAKTQPQEKAASLNIDFKDGFGHSYITFVRDFRFDQAALDEALEAVNKQNKRYIKVCIPANTPEAIKTAEYLISKGFVFHSYLPLYGYGEKSEADHLDASGDETASNAKRPEFYDILSLQWIKPEVVEANQLPGETNSVIKLYGYPENLSGQIIRIISGELQNLNANNKSKIEQGDR